MRTSRINLSQRKENKWAPPPPGMSFQAKGLKALHGIREEKAFYVQNRVAAAESNPRPR